MNPITIRRNGTIGVVAIFEDTSGLKIFGESNN